MPTAPPKGKTVPVIADHDQVVEIHWRLKNGQLWIDRRECPNPEDRPASA